MRDRARLFDAVVTPAVLYGSATWTMTKAMDRDLRTVRRKMLRYVFRIHRQRAQAPERPDDEEWPDFLRRAARNVDSLSCASGMTDWILTSRSRKWQFAGKLARATDDRWSRQVLLWKPNHGLGRAPGHPATRWSDALEQFAGGDWMSLAADKSQWDYLEAGFVSFEA